MIDLGVVKPGSTIRIPFSSFDKDDGSSITMTNFAVADILIFKDGSTTERASTAGFTATTDFDAKTGKHVAIIDLADNTTAGFYAAGSEYLVAIDAVTIDAVTTGGWIARFTIGYPDAVLNTTIATLASQTSFTLTSGPAEDDALNNCQIVIHDVASAVQVGRAVILDYTGSTKTVTLAAGTTFTAAATDNVAVLGLAPLIPTTAGRTLDVSAGGEAGVDWANVGSPTTSLALTGTTIATTQKVDVETIKTNPVVNGGTITFPTGATLASTTNITGGTITTVSGNVTGTVGGFTTAAKAEIQTEAEDAIVAHRLDELLNADSDIDGAAPPTVGSVFHELMSKTAGSFTFDQTTDSCEALRDRGDAAWTTATGFSTHTAADVWAAATRTLTAGTNIQLPANGLANVTAWTVAITGNITGNLSGSVGSVTGAVGSVTGAVGSVTGAVGSIASGGITAASFGAGAIDAAAIAADAIGTSEFSTAAANKIADIVLRRTMTSVEASSFGETLDVSSLYGDIQSRQEWSISGSTLTVKKVDGSTTLGTKALGTTAGVDPITSVS